MYLKSWIVVDGQAEDVERSRNRFKKKMQLIEVGTYGTKVGMRIEETEDTTLTSLERKENSHTKED